MDSATQLPAAPFEPLVARACTGDREAEREVCRRLLPAMRAFAQRRLSAAAAEDFAHDALVLLIEALREGRVQEPARLAGFALGICRNLARERARLGERRRELLVKYGFSADEPSLFAPVTELHRGHLEDCYSQLTEHARRVIRSTFCDERADLEIAGELSISEANVRVIRHRSLAALRTCLEKPISWSQQA